MGRSVHALAALWLFSALSWAAAPPDEPPQSSQGGRLCTGVNNEVAKSRDLYRELNAYAGSTAPQELQDRVTKHIDLVARLKAECERNRDQAVLKK